MEDALHTQLLAAVGTDAVDAGRNAVAPGSTDAVAAICRVCRDTATPMVVSSSGPVEVVTGISVSLHTLSEVRLNSARMVVYAGAGADLARLREMVAGGGLRLVGVPSSVGPGRVGSLIARGAVPRRALTGVLAVLASGDRVASQGGVHKDVTGYDLVGALLGSMGRLALITGAYFRLVPAGATLAVGNPPGPAEAAGLGRVLATAFDPDGLLRPADTVTRPPAQRDRA